MQIGIEGDGDKSYIVVQFGDGERAVKGPMPEEEARAWIDGILAEMNEEGFESSKAIRQSSADDRYTWIGLLVTLALLGLFMFWWLR